MTKIKKLEPVPKIGVVLATRRGSRQSGFSTAIKQRIYPRERLPARKLVQDISKDFQKTDIKPRSKTGGGCNRPILSLRGLPDVVLVTDTHDRSGSRQRFSLRLLVVTPP
jgi:hypothetical protein